MLVGFTGNMGSGKTLTMTILAYVIAKKHHIPVFSNYWTEFSTGVKSWDEVYKIERGILLLDEAHVPFDSRAFADDHGRTHFILQTRKKNLLVFFTTQHISQVDKRIRNVCDFIVACSKRGDTLKNQIIDYQSEKLGRKMKIRQVHRFYRLYNTNELVYNFKRAGKGWKR